ncbi:MAG TPA: ABC transporter ATP-binding protein [Chloroflexia bacterium]|nr:ABC transporter ATP-binding protein [Chloroflexia bacterium]
MSVNETNNTDTTRNGWRKFWRSTAEAFSNVPGAFKLVWEAHRSATIAMAITTLVMALLPAAQAWTGKLIVDSIVDSLNRKLAVDTGLGNVLPVVILEFFLFALNSSMLQVRTLLDHLLNARLTHHVQTTIIRKALTLDLHFFENSSYYDQLQNAQREVNWRPLSIVRSSFLLAQDTIQLISLLALLIAFGPIVALLLFGAALPSFVAQMRYSRLYFRLLTWHAPEFRLKSYWEQLLTVDSSMKEIKLFGLGAPLLRRYEDQFWKFYREDTALAGRRTFMSIMWGVLAALSYYGAYAWTIYRTLRGELTLGDLTLYLTVLRQSQGSFQGIFSSLGEIYEGSLFMSNLFGFLKLKPLIASADEGQRPVPHPIRQGIEFCNVSFRYPGSQEWALRNLNLSIGPNEKLALVGANGAGKTTLVKLLTRLYEPTEGEIRLDGVNLRDYRLSELHQRIGVIFQDFVRYQATARENIGFGQIAALDDAERIRLSARKGGADSVIEELPQDYETMLGRWFEGGQELSGGEWQKIALSRAFMRDGEVLVLDEPTAALDAGHEYEIFQRFRELTAGKIALLISHRFSTVRMADRIAVIEDGQLIELGSHAELLALNGTYARLFNLQAEGYR